MKVEADLERNKDDTSKEITQRNMRRNKIIAFNITESKSEDPNKKKTHDQESFLQLCREELKLDDIEVDDIEVDDIEVDGIEVDAVTRLQIQIGSQQKR